MIKIWEFNQIIGGKLVGKFNFSNQKQNLKKLENYLELFD